MPSKSPFIIPVQGLSLGVHEYEMIIDNDFFADFSHSPVTEADVKLHLLVDRTARGMTLTFDFAGHVGSECDRCLSKITLPIDGRHSLAVKFTLEADEQEDEAELIYLHPETGSLDTAPFAYDFILLSIPMIKSCQDQDVPNAACDEEMISRIYGESSDEIETEGNNHDTKPPSPWDVLKDIK